MTSNKFKQIFSGVFCLSALLAAGIDLSGYKESNVQKTPVPTVINPSFEEGAKGWKLNGKAKVERGLGTVGSGGLMIERTDPKEYQLTGQSLQLIPGRVYNFSIMIRGEGIKGADLRGGSFCVEFSDKNGKWIRGGAYPKGVYGTTDWVSISINNMKIPENAGKTSVCLYLWRGCTGKVYYDDLIVVPVEIQWTVYALNAPMGIIAPGKELRLAFNKEGKTIMTAAAPGKLAVCAEFNGQQMSAVIQDDTATLRLPAGLTGKGELQLTVVDTARKLILEKLSLPLTVAERPPQPAASCRIDEQGFAVVNGKRFLPIGVYCNAQFSWELDKLRKLGFNTLLPYNSFSMGFSRKKPGWDRIGEIFDYCEKHDMKIIFSMKDVYQNAGEWAITSLYGEPTSDAVAAKTAQLFRSRPGLLGYYICDELPNQMIPEMTARRRQLNAIDPEHPVWIGCAIGYTTESTKIYGPATDVTGADLYPINNNYSIKKMENGLRITAEAGQPFWIVPQMFNWRRYRVSDPKADTFRFPSADEFRAMILLSAGYGAKGFVFYTYTPICKPDPKLDGDTAENLKTVQEGIAMLRELEPFLLSGKPIKRLPVKAVKGDIRAWEFSDNGGGRRIAVLALGPGSAEAEITVGSPEKLKSVYGKSVLKNGKWLFRAENIDCDIIR